MSRILFATVGSFGDVNPFVALALEARRRGHVAMLAGPASFESHVRRAGIDFAPLGDARDLGTLIREHKLMHGFASGNRVMELLLDEAPRGIADLRACVTAFRPDAIVAHKIVFGARWLAEEFHAAYVNVDLAPLVWFSRHDPVPSFQMRPGTVGKILGRAMHPLWPLGRGAIDRRLNTIRRDLGLPREKSPWTTDVERAAASLGLWGNAFRGPMRGDPPRSRICGFTLHDDREDAAPPSDVERFLDAGEAPIVFALGSTAVFNAGRFYADAVATCERLKRRGLLLVGIDENVPARLPPSVAAFRYAPYSSVFPRAAAVVVHGGVGSMAQGLLAGVPVLVVPFAHDQFNNGVRVHALGVGGTLWRTKVDVDRFTRALTPLLEDASLRARARALGAELRAEDGAANAVEGIESALATAPCDGRGSHGTAG